MIRLQRATTALFVAVCVTSISSCTMARITARSTNPIVMNNPPVSVEVIEHIVASRGITFDFTSSFDASEILAVEFQRTGADAMVNVAYAVKTTVGDFFLNLLTLGIATAKHLEIEADAVRTPNGLTTLLENGGAVVVAHGSLLAMVSASIDATMKDRNLIAPTNEAEGEYQLLRLAEVLEQ